LKDYDSFLTEIETECTEKRSRFICAIKPVTTAEEAMSFIEERREMHYDARHTVYAYLLKDGVCRYSDDGEPQGTGGQPVLEVIKRSGLVDVCVAVTRYFGGILLGAGGLTRAYSGGAALAVSAAQRVTICACVDVKVTADYSQYGIISRILPEHGAETLSSDFVQFVTVEARLKAGAVDGFEKAITEATSGTVPVQRTGEVFAAMKA
jgi:uncharacterized YigZ family protein